ncbi:MULTISPECIES: hypothetical protein [unclassified Bradyrhizobium]|uniref:hypothetical protein n=1 Tax=unclassified Bradyrhizobium TaxID=2631580 RepID=UPI002FF395B6
MNGLATRSFNELIDPRRLRQQLFSGRPIPDLPNERLDAHVCEVKNKDGAAQILPCVNLQTFNARQQCGEVGQNIKWSLARAVRSGCPLVQPMRI